MTCRWTRFKDYVDELQKKKNRSKSSERAPAPGRSRQREKTLLTGQIPTRPTDLNKSETCVEVP
jgi:hypothetical protein